MQRFVGLLLFVFFAFPLGLSIAGCGHGTAVQYCNGNGFGPATGQVAHITLASNLAVTGESLNYGQIGSALSASAQDCLGNSVSVSSFTYSTTDMTVADVNPANGAVCAGTWNRNTGGGINNYTVCTPPTNPTNHTALITAAANGAVSNPIQVYIHPQVTGVVLGNASVSCPTNANATAGTDPATNCQVCNPNSAGIVATTAGVYNENSCVSQNGTAQLVARVYANGTTNPADNITCQVGPLTYALQGTTNIASIAADGVVTFNQPGSALVTAAVSNSSSALNSGFVSTCPPKSIVLSPVTSGGTSSNSINVAVNTAQQFNATVTDTNNNPINGLALEFTSTLPVNFPTSSSTVTPAYPGSATITAACVPPTCNPSPFSQIGLFGNGQPVTSNGVEVTAPGTVSNVLYAGSTNSLYVASENFTTGQLAAPIRLPYLPNSMVISQDGTTIYMGSNGGLMVIGTASGALSNAFQTIQGTVLAVAPNNTYVVVTNPALNTVSLVTPSGTVFSTFNGTGTSAQWTPDSNTLYVTTAPGTNGTNGNLLTYSTFVGWESTATDETYTNVAVTVPNVGAYFAGQPTTDGRSACANTTVNTLTTPNTTTNIFSPQADSVTAVTDVLAATTDGKHILGATVKATPATLTDITPTLPVGVCPVPVPANYFASTFTTHPLNGIAPTAITGVVPSTASNVAFVTYTGTGGVLPLYAPAAGTLTNIPLSGTAIAPVAGVFSTDNTTFYAGTSGDDLVHVLSVTGTTAKDTGTIAPALPPATGTGLATPNLIVERVIRATS